MLEPNAQSRLSQLEDRVALLEASTSMTYGMLKKVLRALNGIPAPDGWIRMRDLKRRERTLEPKVIEDMLRRLADEGAIEVRRERVGAGAEAGGGRESVLMRVVDLA